MNPPTTNSVKVPGLAAEVRTAFCEKLYSHSLDPDKVDSSSFGDKLYSPLRHPGPGLGSGEFAVENTLHEKVLNSRAVILKGIAGVGKTTLASYYFERFRKEKMQSQDLVLWTNLKNKTVKIQESFFEDIHELLERHFGHGFSKKKEIWTRYIDAEIASDLKDARKQGSGAESDLLRTSIINWSRSKQKVVEEFVGWWLEQDQRRKVFLVIDNVDTMKVELQTTALRFALDQIDGSTRLGELASSTIVTVRPETVQEYYVAQQLDSSAVTLNVPALKLRPSLELRLDFIKERLEGESRQMQSIVSVQAPEIPDRKECRWLSDDCPSSPFLMMNLASNAKVFDVFDVLAQSIKDAVDPGVAVSSVVEGARDEPAWKIYRHLCGRSMRRAVQVSRSIMSSQGILQDAANNGKLRPYVFLDAVVERALNTDEGAYVTNLFSLSDDFEDSQSTMFLPTLVAFLSSHMQDCDERSLADGLEARGDLRIDRRRLTKKLEQCGFDEGIVEIGLSAARRGRLLVPIYGDDHLVAYLINRNLVLAHQKLLWEPAYVDNTSRTSQFFESNVSAHESSGFLPKHFGARVTNTVNFLAWLRRNEQAWIRNISETDNSTQAAITLRKYEIPSFAYGIAWHYASRLDRILESGTAHHLSVPTITKQLAVLTREFYDYGVTTKTIRMKFESKLIADLLEAGKSTRSTGVPDSKSRRTRGGRTARKKTRQSGEHN